MKKYTLDEVYTADMTAFQRERYNRVADEFEKLFGEKPTAFFSAPGRTEVGGNHTDHNFGCVLAAGVSLDVIAAVAPDNEENVITIKSEGFPMDTVNVDDDTIYEEQKNTSAALIRGMSAGFKKNGHNAGGFKAYATSNVLKGSGLSLQRRRCFCCGNSSDSSVCGKCIFWQAVRSYGPNGFISRRIYHYRLC